jgi:hypothetical protein
MATLEQLKSKYQPVIDYAKTRGVHLKNVHVENDKLLIRGDARTSSGTRSSSSTRSTPT